MIRIDKKSLSYVKLQNIFQNLKQITQKYNNRPFRNIGMCLVQTVQGLARVLTMLSSVNYFGFF